MVQTSRGGSDFERVASGTAGGEQTAQTGSRLAQRHEQDEANRERVKTGEVHLIPAFLWVPARGEARLWRKRGRDGENPRQPARRGA